MDQKKGCLNLLKNLLINFYGMFSANQTAGFLNHPRLKSNHRKADFFAY